MKHMQNEAWLDEENRIVSFHEIPDSRYYSTEYQAFGNIIVNLVLLCPVCACCCRCRDADLFFSKAY